MKTLSHIAIVGVALTVVTACSGGPNRTEFLPSAGISPERSAARHGTVRVTMRIPRRHGRRELHPATISPETQSVGIAVNGRPVQGFNVSPSSPGCTASPSGTTCVLSVSAPAGNDSFAIATYSGTNASGAVLDRGTLAATIVLAHANALPKITLGPVVSTTSDGGPGSLRDAVAHAQSGDTIVFVVPNPSTITLQTPIALENGETIGGPGVTGTGPYGGITVSGGGASQLFTVASGVNAAITGLILANGNAATPKSPGGAILNLGTLALTADAFVGSTSAVQSSIRHRGIALVLPKGNLRPHCTAQYAEGGAVYNDGSLSVSGTTFDSNVVKSSFFSGCTYGVGGAIYNDVNGTLTVDTSLFENNSAFEGGGVFNHSSHAATFSNDTFHANTGCNTAALGCAVTCGGVSCSSYATGNGAAIFDASGPGVTIAGSTFSNNVIGGTATTSNGNGGALFLNAGTPAITASTFTGNKTGGGTFGCSAATGGAISAAVPLVLNNDVFTNNVASGDYGAQGGALIDTAGDVTGSGDTFTSNSAQGFGGSTCAPNAAAAGGAIMAYKADALTNSTFSNNRADGTNNAYGGAVYVGATTQIKDDKFDGNEAYASGAGGAASTATGGAIYGNLAFTVIQSTLTNNSAVVDGSNANYAEGGAIYAVASLGTANDTIGSTSTGGNTVTGPAGSSAYAEGGAVFAAGGYTSNTDTISNNEASAPGGANGGAAYTASTISVLDSSFDHNFAVSPTAAQGGALYTAGSGAVTGTAFTSNHVGSTATGSGGAIFDGGGVTFTSITVSSNAASSNGGGLYAGAADQVESSSFSQNQVTAAHNSNGGGAIMNAAPMTVSDTTVYENAVVLVSGAVVAGGGGIMDYNGLSMTGSTVSNNSVSGSSATGGGGGGIYAYDAANITNSTIDYNVSSADGGGIDDAYVGLVLTNDTLYQNYASGSGGNVEILALSSLDGALTIANSIVAGGTAQNGSGADMDVNGTGSLTDKDYNIVGTANTGGNGMTGAHDIVGNPKISALANNGGATQTDADQTSSPGYQLAAFSGTNTAGACGNVTSAALLVDQRGYTRGANGACDSGAYEYAGVAPAVRTHVKLPFTKGHHRVPHVRVRNK